jgi:hypothetical protein
MCDGNVEFPVSETCDEKGFHIRMVPMPGFIRLVIHPFTPPHERFFRSTLTKPLPNQLGDGPVTSPPRVARVKGYYRCLVHLITLLHWPQ